MHFKSRILFMNPPNFLEKDICLVFSFIFFFGQFKTRKSFHKFTNPKGH